MSNPVFGSAEEVLTELQTHPPSGPACQLALADSFTFAGKLDSLGCGMAVILDRMLECGYQPDGFEQKRGYKLYRYKPID